MNQPHVGVDRFRRSILAKAVALWAVAMNGGCYRTWTKRIAPPPAASADSMSVDYAGRSISLHRPQAEGDTAVWGWTTDPVMNQEALLVTGLGVDTIPQTDSVWTRLPLLEERRQLRAGSTIGIVTVLAAGVLVFVVRTSMSSGWITY